MNPVVLLALCAALEQPATAASPPAGHQNVVRICSATASSPCQELDARWLEPPPQPRPAGQLAFTDPGSGAILQHPTAEQLEELSLAIAIEESMARREQITVETLPDGTLKLGPGSSFTVFRQATVERKEEKP